MCGQDWRREALPEVAAIDQNRIVEIGRKMVDYWRGSAGRIYKSTRCGM